MKKLLCFGLIAFPMMALAQESDFYETYDAPDVCPVCECNYTKTAARNDTYSGFRLYMNQHASYTYHMPHHTYEYRDDNFGFGSTVGNRLTDFVRVEYETLYMGSKYTTHSHKYDFDVWANMLNAYLFREYGGAVSPYAGAGLGLTAIWGEMDSKLDNKVDLSYQFMVGVWFDLNSRIALDVGYKYINFGKVDHNVGNTRIDATQFYVGASYKFGI